MRYELALKRLYGLNRFHKFKYSLDATKSLCRLIGNPEKKLQFVHVTGTNGKGSFAFKTTEVLKDNGVRTGLFTSPHLSTFRERIQVDGRMIEKEFIEDFLAFAFQAIECGQVNCSFFEILTCLGFKYFEEKGAEVVSLEVGIGGKMDATNVIPSNLLAVLTSIDLDHCGLLGDTREEITIQKCGIIKAGRPVLIGPTVPRHIVEPYTRRLGGQMYQLSPDAPSSSFWRTNEALVEKGVSLLERELGRGLVVRPEILRKSLPGRCEFVPQSQLKELQGPESEVPGFVVLDVGHNPKAIESFLESLSELTGQKKFVVVFGTSSLKDSESSLKLVSRFASKLFLIEAKNNRAKKLQLLEDEVRRLGIDYHVVSSGDIGSTLRQALGSQEALNSGVAVCGSFFIMQETRQALKYQDEADEDFLNEFHPL